VRVGACLPAGRRERILSLCFFIRRSSELSERRRTPHSHTNSYCFQQNISISAALAKFSDIIANAVKISGFMLTRKPSASLKLTKHSGKIP